MMLGDGSNTMSKGGFFTAAVVIYFGLILIALVVNSIMFVVLWRLRKSLFQPPGTFYPVVLFLLLFTTLNAIVQAVFVAPDYVQNAVLTVSTSSYMQTFSILDMLANYGILGFSTLVAANRFSTFLRASECPVFVRPRVHYLIVLVCIIIIIVSVVPSLFGCTMVHAATAAGYVDMCPNEGLSQGIRIALTATYYVVCLVSAYFYVRTYLLIRHQRGNLIEKESHRKAPETVILKQALVIFGLYVTSLLVSTILPIFCTSNSFLLSFSLNSIGLLLSIVYPGLFLVSARDMRKEIISWIPCKTNSCLRREKHRISSAESITGRYGMQSNT